MGRPKLEDRPSTLNRSERPKRVPINGQRDVMTVGGKEAGWHYCFVNDDQVAEYELAAYEHVTHEVTVGNRKINAASQLGGKISKAVGNGVTAYLMRVPDEYYEADRKAEAEELDAKEASMKAALNSKKDGQYGEVKIEQNKPLGR